MVNAGAMDILLVGAAIDPWTRALDSAGTMAALAKTFKQLGHGVSVVVPYSEEYEAGGLLVARRLSPLTLADGRQATVFDAPLSSGARLTLLGLPGQVQLGFASTDPALQLSATVAFGEAVAALISERMSQGLPLDVVHAFDWPASLVPLLVVEPEGALRPTCVISVSEPEVAPVFARELWLAALPAALKADTRVVSGAANSVLRGALIASDAVVAPSPGQGAAWSDVAQTGELASTFAGLARPVVGVLGGVDYARVNPAVDPALPSRFDAEAPQNKQVCRAAFLRQLGVSLEARPVMLYLGPLTRAAGAERLLETAHELVRGGALVAVATGRRDEPELAQRFTELASELSGDLVLFSAPDEPARHRACAAADIVLLPSRLAAAGGLQWVAQRYGAAPVALATGALADGISDADSALVTGTGFLYDDDSSQGLLAAAQRARAAVVSPSWPAFRRRFMKLDLGWDGPARRTLQVYRQCVRS